MSSELEEQDAQSAKEVFPTEISEQQVMILIRQSSQIHETVCIQQSAWN